MFKYLFSILLSPKSTWENVAKLPKDAADYGMTYSLLLALIPTLSFYYGTTQVGWVVGDGLTTKLTLESANRMIPLFYFAQVGAIFGIGWFIHWMSATYGANSSLTKGIRISGLTATPLFLAGIVGVTPQLIVDFTVGIVTASWSTYLLYIGIPRVMNIPEERGFLFSSAIIAICLMAIVVILGASVILWDMGAAPAFTD
ncbi:MAG TPA: Yip1 family protein [Pseudomonadales bacterium]|nr:Yip1 family protein [Pseudomonadales bacterium]